MGLDFERLRRLPGKKIVFAGFLCVSVIFVFFVVASDDRDLRRDLSAGKITSYMEGLRIVAKKEGADSWIVSARRADLSKDESTARMESVTMDIKKEGILVTASRGTYNMNTKDLVLEDNVVIRSRDTVILVGNLSWNQSRELLTSEGRVQVKGGRFSVEGDDLTARGDNKVRLNRNVRAIFE